MDSDHSREQRHVKRVEGHVQNIKTRRLSMI